MSMSKWSQGYMLPAAILLSVAVSIVAVTAMQFTISSSTLVHMQNYKDIAQKAADSGILYADSCLSNNLNKWSSLTSGSTCEGTNNGGSNYLQETTEWRSRFSVAPADGQNNIVSTGTVEILNGGTVVNTITTTSKMNVATGFDTRPISRGESITDLKAQNTDCAIANGKLYCWGRGSTGTIGDNGTSDRYNPTPVGGALAGKTVTRVSVSDVSVCAIGDGVPYCWGQNGQGQLGNGSTSSVRQPTSGYPRISSGALSGNFITDIGTAPANNPAFWWPLAIAVQHSCALKANGSVACWGTNGFRQLSTVEGFCIGVILFGNCVGLEIKAYPDSHNPVLVYGYSNNTGPFRGKKAERVGASSHDSCIVAEGRMYCWGVEAPLSPFCGTPPSPLFYPANVLTVNLNPCTETYSSGYDMSSKAGFFSGFEINSKTIDPSTWEVNTNIGCGMANADFFCVGNGPTLGFQFLPSFKPPWREIANADVTSHDNGDNEMSMTFDGIYCAVDKGVAKCMTSLTSGLLYSGGSGIMSWGALNTSAGLAGNIPVKIAAGTLHGCIAANGRLYCWGVGSNGRLANGSTSSITYPTHTGDGGNTPIGSEEGTYAANGPVSTGDGHTCGIANGQLFCWGLNNYGQLGMGDLNNQGTPLAVPDFSGQYITKVSAGKNHTCAIRFGKLYCWGLNNEGQLGIGNTTNQSEPQLVNGHGALTSSMRVTDVSAGDNHTCAVANGNAYCWGNNSHRKLGDGSTTQRTTPIRVNGTGQLTTSMAVTKVSAGSEHTCAVANADAFCWGWNYQGRTGIGSTSNSDSDPTRLTGGTAGSPTGPNNMRPSVSDIAAGGDFSCGIFNGMVSCWGNSSSGQTGTNTTGTRSTPTNIYGSAGSYYATQVSAGASHACALIHGNNSAINGNIWCWGAGANGRLGNDSTSNSTTPVLINGGATVDLTAPTTPINTQRRVATYISAGASSTCSVANAVIICWGNGADYRLGDGLTAENRVPGVTGGYRFPRPYSKGPIF